MIYIALPILLPVLAAALPSPGISTPITTLTTGDAGACQNFAGACVVYATTVAAVLPPNLVSSTVSTTSVTSATSVIFTTSVTDVVGESGTSTSTSTGTTTRQGNGDGFIDATASAGRDADGLIAGAVQLRSRAHWLASLVLVAVVAAAIALI
ncbi:unnamed protein product [Zymoseptoria tritici ST99CH_3D1]|nr:unnamed protein product [Zymoseptoria tritici ST99CH_3D1]